MNDIGKEWCWQDPKSLDSYLWTPIYELIYLWSLLDIQDASNREQCYYDTIIQEDQIACRWQVDYIGLISSRRVSCLFSYVLQKWTCISGWICLSCPYGLCQQDYPRAYRTFDSLAWKAVDHCIRLGNPLHSKRGSWVNLWQLESLTISHSTPLKNC